MKKHRNYIRIKTNNKITCCVGDKNDKYYMDGVPVIDISPTGLCLISGKEIPKDTMLKLKLYFPVSYADDDSDVLVKVAYCKVEYCDKDTNTNKFRIGCHYIPKKRKEDSNRK